MPLPGLVAYDDDALSDHEHPSSSRLFSNPPARPPPSDGTQLNPAHPSPDQPLATRSGTQTHTPSHKPPIIIRRHAPTKPHPRSRLPDEVAQDPSPSASAGPSTLKSASQEDMSSPPSAEHGDLPDELTRLRELLRPPPITGVEDWGIPPEPEEPCDEAIKAKITTFLALKHSPTNPRHFNDSLMANRAFRNPHLYAKLVEFVDVDERTTNFPKGVWDPRDVREEWYADRIAEVQKARSEATSAAQQSSKRARIDFTAGSGPPASSSSASASALAPNSIGRLDGKQGRHQPYSVPGRGKSAARSEGVLGGGYGKGRERRRWA